MSRPIPTGLWMADESRFEADEQSAERRSSERVGLGRITFPSLLVPLGCRWRYGWIFVTDHELAEAGDEYGISTGTPFGAVVTMPYPSPREQAVPPC